MNFERNLSYELNMHDTNQVLYSVSRLPVLQNRVFSSAAAAINCSHGDVTLIRDERTGIIHNSTFDPKLVVYDEAYDNEQSYSTAYLEHLKEVTQLILQHLGSERLFEIGCGKGRLIEALQHSDCDVSGCDRSYVGKNPRVIRDLYPFENAPKHKHLILRHVLEHIPDPIAFLRTIAEVNHGGMIYIEVPCLEWILQKRTWFDVFYEHVNYFQLADFQRFFSKTHAAGHFFGGQYLYVIADLDDLLDEPSISESVAATSAVSIPEDFEPKFEETAKPDDVVWGAASKGVRYCLARQQRGCPVDAAVDINPAKQNHFLPGSGVRVISPEEFLHSYSTPRRIVVMNSNYFDEIYSLAGSEYEYEVIDK